MPTRNEQNDHHRFGYGKDTLEDTHVRVLNGWTVFYKARRMYNSKKQSPWISYSNMVMS